MIKRILLVDDDFNDRELCKIAFERVNLLDEIVTFDNGREALDFLMHRGAYALREPGNPSVILLDFKMPEIDGLDVLTAIRSNAETATIPVVMLTGSTEEQNLVDSYGLGVNAFIIKPVDFSEFIKTVTKVSAFWGIVNEAPVGSARYISSADEGANR